MQLGYLNEVYYNLSTGSQSEVEIRNWDVAFAVHLFEVTVLTNPINGVTVLKSPYDVTEFNDVDTTGLTSWPVLNNQYQDWSAGTLIHAASSGSLDYGWGSYDPSSHVVMGTRVFILRLFQNGQTTYKKFYIVIKDQSGNWQFRLSNLDGTQDVTRAINVSTYQQRHFVYYNISLDELLNREPEKNSWDILFTRYFAPIGNSFYPTTGVLSNKNVEAAKAVGVDKDAVEEDDIVDFYSSNISTIGYDWKTFSNGVFVLQDSLVYFVKTQQDHVYKLCFTSFDAATGTIVINKSSVSTNVSDPTSGVTSLSIYPNPSQSNSMLFINAKEGGLLICSVYNAAGQLVEVINNEMSPGLRAIPLHTDRYGAGIYIVRVQTPTGNASIKFIKN